MQIEHISRSFRRQIRNRKNVCSFRRSTGCFNQQSLLWSASPDVSHTLIDVYIYRKSWREFQHNSTHIFLSHLREYKLPGGRIQPHVGRTKRTDCTDFLLLGFCRKFDQRWLWSTLGPIKLKICGKFDFWRPYYLAQKSRSKSWPFCCCVDF